MAGFVMAVASVFQVTLTVSPAYAALAMALSRVWNSLLINYALGRISRTFGARPENAIAPDPELMAKYGGLLKLESKPPGAGEPIIELFDGFDPANRNVEWAALSGDCMSPNYPSGRTAICLDTSLPVRSGDLAVVRYQPKRLKYRHGRHVKAEPEDLFKWAVKGGDTWVLYSMTEDPFVLHDELSFRGRVVATVVMPEGMECGFAKERDAA